MTPSLARKVDANQSGIVDSLRRIGAKVYVCSSFGRGFPDLMVGYRGSLWLLEVKDGSKPPSARKLTPEQVDFHQEWAGYPVYVVESVQEAIEVVTGG